KEKIERLQVIGRFIYYAKETDILGMKGEIVDIVYEYNSIKVDIRFEGESNLRILSNIDEFFNKIKDKSSGYKIFPSEEEREKYVKEIESRKKKEFLGKWVFYPRKGTPPKYIKRPKWWDNFTKKLENAGYNIEGINEPKDLEKISQSSITQDDLWKIGKSAIFYLLKNDNLRSIFEKLPLKEDSLRSYGFPQNAVRLLNIKKEIITLSELQGWLKEKDISSIINELSQLGYLLPSCEEDKKLSLSQEEILAFMSKLKELNKLNKIEGGYNLENLNITLIPSLPSITKSFLTTSNIDLTVEGFLQLLSGFEKADVLKDIEVDGKTLPKTKIISIIKCLHRFVMGNEDLFPEGYLDKSNCTRLKRWKNYSSRSYG
ncbi:MAG: hypothetical protein NC820_05530, partial [Candidatus Omnitrophica bacterium]|nr:hypothetical protein [Candidatus Omnitrophota bacterium]